MKPSASAYADGAAYLPLGKQGRTAAQNEACADGRSLKAAAKAESRCGAQVLLLQPADCNRSYNEPAPACSHWPLQWLATSPRTSCGPDPWSKRSSPGPVDETRLQAAPPEPMPSAPRTSPASLGNMADRKSTRLNSSHANISYAVFCLKKKKKK